MDLKTFIFTHWKLIVISVLIVIDIVVNLFKKKVKIIDVMTIVLRKLPGYVREAEATGLSGSSKYTRVFSRAIKDLMLLTGLSNEQVCAKYSIELNDAIEDNVAVLNDFKKGENNEKV